MHRLFAGYDPRESVVFHTFVQSVLDNCSEQVGIYPLSDKWMPIEGRRDGSNDFIYSRFLVPWLCSYRGLALYVDGDMILRGDLAELFKQLELGKALAVVKHDYQTKAAVKYLGAKNENYPRKNWSSVMLFDCAHYMNRCLTPEYIASHEGAHLHRFQWLPDDRIGELPREWNWLVGEYEPNDRAKLLHYTLGAPCFPEYADCDHAGEWRLNNWKSQEPLTAR